MCEAMTKANTAKGQLLCKKVAKAKVATGNCVQDDWKKAGEERVLLKHPCTGRLRRVNAARSNHV